jgi:hypothetical protein
MRTEPKLQGSVFERIQDAESAINTQMAIAKGGKHSETAIAVYDSAYKKHAYRSHSLKQRLSEWEEEKAWDKRDIKDRINSGWFGGRW